MKITAELDKDEVKAAIREYLREEKREIVPDNANISFNIERKSAQPGSTGRPRLVSAECEGIQV